jgi:opacity protein-like surface antigen
LSATVSGGYSIVSFADKYEEELLDFNMNTDAEAYIPLKVGARYYFTKYIYGAGEIGAALAVTKDSSTGFAWAPGVGISYPVIKKHEIDAGIRYESWEQSGFSTSQIGLHVAFKF